MYVFPTIILLAVSASVVIAGPPMAVRSSIAVAPVVSTQLKVKQKNPNPLQASADVIQKGFKRIFDGVKSIPANYMEAEKLKKVKKRRGLKALSYSQFRFLEHTKEDLSKLLRMAITFPFSPEFFFYSYIVFPMMAPHNPWAWNTWPTGFDSDPIDIEARKTTIDKRRIQAVVSSLVALKGEAVDELDAAKREQKNKHVQIVEAALKSKNLKDAIDACQSLLYTKIVGKPNAVQLVIENAPGAAVKAFCRSIGVEGVPNIPIIRRMNTGEVAKYIDKIRESDEFLLLSGITKLEKNELEQACHERCIRTGSSRNEKALRADLQEWLDIACDPIPLPRIKAKQVLNEQNRRLALLSLHAVKTFKVSDSASVYRSLLN